MDKLECVGRIPLFAGLPKRFLRMVGQLCVERRYPAGHLLCQEGTVGVGLFFILEGRVEVFGTTPAGEERRLAVLGPGEFFGEMMVLDRRPRSASVRSLEPTLCYLMTHWDFRALLKTQPDLALRLLPTLVGRIRELDRAVLT